MEFQKLLLKNISITVGGVVILATFIFFVGNDISNRGERIQAEKIDLKVRLDSLGSLVSLRAEAGNAQKLLNNLQVILPIRSGLVLFGRAIESLAKNSQISPLSNSQPSQSFGGQAGQVFSFGNEVVGDELNPGKTDFSLRGVGQFSSLVRFLKSLENGGYFINLNSLDFSQSGNSKSLEINVRGQVFSQ